MVKCLLRIRNAIFRLNTQRNVPPEFVFKKPIQEFEVFKPGDGPSSWGVVGPRKSAFLDISATKYICDPATSRIYPSLKNPGEQIEYLNFRESSGLDKVHLSARYESYSYKGVLEMTDNVNSVMNYITGANNYNSMTKDTIDGELVKEIMDLFELHDLKHKWINSLSNGQMRRARIAKSLITRPKMLVIDDPFLGLDPTATVSVSNALNKVSNELNIGLLVGLRIQDEIPKWITHIAFVEDCGITCLGRKEDILEDVMLRLATTLEMHKTHELKHKKSKSEKISSVSVTDPIIEFLKASVIYKGQPVLKDFSWKVQRGSRWRILGDNGSGKTTLLSLITADHPQSWRSVITINGVLRKTGSGVSYFDINNKIGISSPEIHALVPPRMRMGEIIMNGLIPDIGNSNFKFRFDPNRQEIGDFAHELLQEFDDEISPFLDVPFNNLTVSQQKLALFLRAVIKNPEILILDEAFSCMDDEAMMMKCHKFISRKLDSTTILAIGHIEWEVPPTDYTLQLTGDEQRSYNLFINNAGVEN